MLDMICALVSVALMGWCSYCLMTLPVKMVGLRSIYLILLIVNTADVTARIFFFK